MDDNKYTLGDGDTAEDFYRRREGSRQGPLDRARELAQFTIPSEFPPEGYVVGDKLGSNNQSIGSLAVSTLASNLMFLAFPPGRPMVRYQPIQHKLRKEAEQDPELWSKVKLALALKELEHRSRIETTPLRTAYTGYITQLLIGGNCLWHQMNLDEPRWHGMGSYVVQRSSTGHPLVTVLKETVSVVTLAPDIQEQVRRVLGDELRDKPVWEQKADIYTVCKLAWEGADARVWLYWQEVKGEVIPGTEATVDYDIPPMYPGWLRPIFGQDWGQSYCDLYRGDLFTVENAASSLNDGAAIAALLLLFLKPGARTSAKQIKEAQNMAVLIGAADDLSAFHLDKAPDFQFVTQHAEQAATRLNRAFLSQTSIVRNAERVTTAEISRLGAEIDKAMGGLYSAIAQGSQRHVVLRAIALHEEEDPSIPTLPPGVIRTAIVTGIDAMGSTTEEEALTELGMEVNQTFGPQAASSILNPFDFTRRLAAEKGVNPEGLVKDEQQAQAEQQQQAQQAMQQSLIDKATGPVAGTAAKAMADAMSNQQPAAGQ